MMKPIAVIEKGAVNTPEEWAALRKTLEGAGFLVVQINLITKIQFIYPPGFPNKSKEDK